MDNYNNNFDPTNEYAPLSSPNTENADEAKKPEEAPNTVIENEDKADDVFAAFDKAKAQGSSLPIDSDNSQKVNTTPAPQPQPQSEYIPPRVNYNQRVEYYPPQPQAPQQNNFTPPQYRAPQPPVYQNPAAQYAPPAYKAPQYTVPQNPNQYQAPQYNPNPIQTQNPYPYQNNQPRQSAAPQPQNQAQTQTSPQQSAPDYSNYNPYAHNQQPTVTAQKQKTPTGVKVLIAILSSLLVIFMIAFFTSCSMLTFGITEADTDNPLKQFATQPENDIFDEFYGEDFSPYFNFGGKSYDSDTFKEDITLDADDGKTQEKDSDKKENSYKPDKDFKDIKAQAIPKNKTEDKQTAQSAYDTVKDAVVSIEVYEDKITDNELDVISGGTGAIISADGYILTNSHVIGDSKQYSLNVVLTDGKKYRAKVVGYDTRTDLAVIKIDAKDLTPVEFGDSSLVKVGQDVVAIGAPGGTSFQNSLTKGIVSAVDRKLELNANVKYIQIDAAINPGNSGGPLCNLYGQVIGINTAKIAAESFEGMGFAIPTNTALDIANDLIKYGYVQNRVMLGLMGMEVDEQMIYQYSVPHGILITDITEGGPLDNTKVDIGDIITAIDGVEVSTFQEVYDILATHKPGDEIEISVYRLKE